MTSYEEQLGPIHTRLVANDDGARSRTTPAADDPRVTGSVDVGPLLDFIDEPRHADDWEREAARKDKIAHAKLLRSLGVHERLVGLAWQAQRVQAEGTLAALHGAVV